MAPVNIRIEAHSHIEILAATSGGRYVHANVNSLRPMFDEIAQGLMLNYDGSYLGDDEKPEHTCK